MSTDFKIVSLCRRSVTRSCTYFVPGISMSSALQTIFWDKLLRISMGYFTVVKGSIGGRVGTDTVLGVLDVDGWKERQFHI